VSTPYVSGFLIPTQGTVTTPDPGPLPDEVTLVYKVRGPTAGTANTIASQWPNSPNNSFMFQRTVGSTNHSFWYSTTGSNSVQRSSVGAAVTPTADQYLATAIKRSTFLNRPWQSTDDGVTWTPIGAGTTTATVPSFFDSTDVLRIGARSVNIEPWNGLIYYVELRTGLDPAAGTVLWRFDANEAPVFTPTLDSTLNVDTDGNGIADGWRAYTAGAAAISSSRSVEQSGSSTFQHIVANPNGSGSLYGIELATTIPCVPGDVLTGLARVQFATSNGVAVTSSWYPQFYNASNVIVGSGTGGTAIPIGGPSDVALNPQLAVAPANTAYARPMFRVYGASAAADGTIPGVLDVYSLKIFVNGVNYIDPRGRTWTLNRPAAITSPVGDDLSLFPPVVAAPTVPAPSVTRDPTIHGLVGAQYGDLEFDVGKSVRWTQWFTDTVFITDINTGEQRYWVVNWAASFPQAFHSITGVNFFYSAANAASFRKAQFEAAQAEAKMGMDDNDWVLFVDAHEGMSCDANSLPNDITTHPFRSYVFREVTRAIAAGADYACIPFFVFLRHVTQNVSYPHPGGTPIDPDVPTSPTYADQPVAVPYYLPYQGLKRLWRVGALKAPGFNWTQLDQPAASSTGVKIQIVSYAYAHWNIQDIVPPATTVPPLSLANDDGFRMRKLISKVRSAPGLPYDDAHWNPTNDPAGAAGPWAFAQPNSPDPVAGTPAPPTVDPATAGILTPLYDLTFRLNLRDGLFWAGDSLGNIPLQYDNATNTWVPVVQPEDWHETDTYVARL